MATNYMTEDDDLLKGSRAMMARTLAKRMSEKNPSLGGNVLNALAMGLMGMYENMDRKDREKAQDAVIDAMKPGGQTVSKTPELPSKPEDVPIEPKTPATQPQYLRPQTETAPTSDYPPATLSSEPGANPKGQDLGRALLLDYAKRNNLGGQPTDTPSAMPPSTFQPNADPYMQTAGIRPPPEAGFFPQGDQSMVAPRLDQNVAFGPQGMGPQQGPDYGNPAMANPMDMAPQAPQNAQGSPEWQRLQEYQRSQGQAPQTTPDPAMMRPGYTPPGGPPGPQPAAPQQAGLDPRLTDFVKRQEGFSPTAKWDHKQYSIGYGTKGSPGQTMTREQAEGPLQSELAKARQSVEQFAPNAPPGVKDALTSLTYNAGPGWQKAGLGQRIQAGDYEGAKNNFMQYVNASGQRLPGLENRRNAELANLWNVPGGQGAPAQTAYGLGPNAPFQSPSTQQAAPAGPQLAQAGGGAPPGQLAPRLQQSPDNALAQKLESMRTSSNPAERQMARQMLFDLYSRKPEFEHRDIPGVGRQFYQKDNPTNMFIMRDPAGTGEAQAAQKGREAYETERAQGRAKMEATKEGMKAGQQVAGTIVSQDIERAISIIEESPGRTTGVGGAMLQNVPETAANNVAKLLDSVKANTSFQQLNAMRAASPTGGALGNVTEGEHKLLQSTMGSLELSQSKDQLVYNLRRVQRVQEAIVHGGMDAAVKAAAEAPPKGGSQTRSGVKWSIE